MSKDRKFVALFDLHVGREFYHGENGLAWRQTHDPGMIKLASAFIKEFEPDTLIFGGDQIHGTSISHHNKNKLVSFEQDAYVKELDNLRNIIFNLGDGLKENMVWLQGNHDAWIDDYKEKYPQFQTLLDPFSYLGFKGAPEWTYVPQGKWYKLGKLWFVHGDTLGTKAANGSAQKAVDDWNVNLRFGHYHTWQVATRTSRVDEKEKKTAVCVPAMCNTNAVYAKNRPNACIQGFQYGYVSKTGNFSDYTVIVAGSEVTIEGKVYKK